MNDHSAAVEVRELRKIYGGQAAVDGLTLRVPRGCFYGFLGPNGAGKTTTIRMLMGLAPPTAGEIEILGLPMPERGLEIKQRIGLVPDETLLFDLLTGAEYLEFVGRMSASGALLGNYDATERLLQQYLPPERVLGIMDELRGPAGRNMWEKLGNVQEEVLANYLKNEYPQTVAVVLVYFLAAYRGRRAEDGKAANRTTSLP